MFVGRRFNPNFVETPYVPEFLLPYNGGTYENRVQNSRRR